jgi:hypothetical protein
MGAAIGLRNVPRDNYDERSCCLTEICSRGAWRCLIGNVPIPIQRRWFQIRIAGELRSVASGW